MLEFWQAAGAPLRYPAERDLVLPHGKLRLVVPNWLEDLHDWLTPDDETCEGFAWLSRANAAVLPQFKLICQNLDTFEALVRLGAPEEAFRQALESLS